MTEVELLFTIRKSGTFEEQRHREKIKDFDGVICNGYTMSEFRYHIYPTSLHQTSALIRALCEYQSRRLMKTSGINMISKFTNVVSILCHFLA